jgi:hypothetical protein
MSEGSLTTSMVLSGRWICISVSGLNSSGRMYLRSVLNARLVPSRCIIMLIACSSVISWAAAAAAARSSRNVSRKAFALFCIARSVDFAVFSDTRASGRVVISGGV